MTQEIVSNHKLEWKVFKTLEDLGLGLLKQLETLSTESIKDHGHFSIALSGGSFPQIMANGIQQTSKKKNNIDFTKWKVFWCDERCVPLNDKESNYNVFQQSVMTTILQHNKNNNTNNIITDDHIFPMDDVNTIRSNDKSNNKNDENKDTNHDEEMCKQLAKLYHKKIMKEFNLKDEETVPQFDCICLGMGPDGHTASLFPKHSLLNSKNVVDYVTDSPKPPSMRITFTLPMICNSKNIVFVATGKSKSQCVNEIRSNINHNKQQQLPSGIVTANAKYNVTWLLDEEASDNGTK